jgi:hypothetical protein
MSPWPSTALVLGLAACSSSHELPEPPASSETDAALADYESPSGTVDRAELSATLESVRQRLDELDIAYLPRLVLELLTALDRRIDSSSLPDDPTEPAVSGRPVITAAVELDRICQGWMAPAAPPAEENGTVAVTATFERSRLQSRLWGTAVQCRQRLTPFDMTVPLPAINLFLDGTLIVHLYGALPDSATDGDFWAGFSGKLGREANVRDVTFDFRVVDGRIEFRHPVDDGNIIIGVGLTSVEMRSAGASFSCDLTTESCQPI